MATVRRNTAVLVPIGHSTTPARDPATDTNNIQTHMALLRKHMTELNEISRELIDREEGILPRWNFYQVALPESLNAEQRDDFVELSKQRRVLSLKQLLAHHEHRAIHHHCLELGLKNINECEGLKNPHARCWELPEFCISDFADLQRVLDKAIAKLKEDGLSLD
ncbi:hypothetical protein TWF694_011723 [Orbilia ellipsospora]|uniref:Uncharacterized protein n=1 Tax=Orbilia ellipsospora TaxID=2528407 RepID=A0AAV9X6D5_9PEZI